MELIIWIAVLMLSLIVLIKASDIFIDSSEKLGIYLGIPSFVIGVVIVGLGTSLPELVSSILSVRQGASEIVIGNVLGSNITNIFLILSIAAILGKEFTVEYNLLQTDLPFLLGSAIFISVSLIDGNFSMGEAIITLLLLFFYLIKAFEKGEQQEEKEKKEKLKRITWILLVLSPVLIFLGAKYTVDAVMEIAKILSIGTEILALSVVALGTSLPELMVTISATKKGQPDMVVGNIVGSNVFNTFAVMGIPRLFGDLKIPADVVKFSMPVHFAATLLFIIIVIDKKVNRWEGFLLIVFYVYFLFTIFKWI